MEKFKLDRYMKESIEFFRNVDCLSLYGVLSAINREDSTNTEFIKHTDKVLKYFNDFDDRSDDENFMKCLLGYYELVDTRFKVICPVCDREDRSFCNTSIRGNDEYVSFYSNSIECNRCGFVQQI